MKTKPYLILLLSLIAIGCYGQSDGTPKLKSCPSYGVIFCNQQEIDSFPYQYSNCGELVGGILISGDDIVNLDGLSFLTAIWGDLEIANNPFLKSLKGLENLMPGTINNLTITGNTVLSVCEIRGLCTYLAAPNGEVTIHSNAPGCNSVQELKGNCGIADTEVLPLSDERTIFPNPTSGRVNIRLNLENQARVKVEIINYIGQIEATLADEVLVQGMHEISRNLSGFSPGIYYCRIISGNRIKTEKIIIEK